MGGAEIAMGSAQTAAALQTSVMSMHANKKMQQGAQRHAEKMADQAWQRELEMWNKTNAYNTPLAQRDRLEAAGISPWSMYGQMDTGNTDTVNPPVADTITPPYLDAQINLGLENLMDTYFAVKANQRQEAQVAKSLEREQAQIDQILLTNDQLRRYNEKVLNAEIEDKLAEFNRKAEQFNWNKQRTLNEWEKHLEEMNAFKRAADEFEWNKSQRNYFEKARELELTNWKFKNRNLELENNLYPLKSDKMRAEITSEFKRQGLTDAEIKLKLQEIEEGNNNLYFSNRRRNIIEETGVDINLDNVILKGLAGQFENMQKRWRESTKPHTEIYYPSPTPPRRTPKNLN